MDKVFQEEEKNLAEVEARIDSIVFRNEREIRVLNAETTDYICCDYDDRERKRELVKRCESVSEQAAQYRRLKASPYYGRIDLDVKNSDESVVCYIGDEGIYDGADIVVFNWRSPITNCYYATNQTEFCVEGIQYLLALRRKVKIEDEKLISYKTEYDGEAVSLEGEIIDPFLIDVLKDKRRHHRLTDIIRTIQCNQNEIIRKPLTESFVVQGCAGSGKTMILLHRLSYLKFNNPNMFLKGVKIITPNRFFNAHIYDLSEQLELTSIERLSVEEYYASLVKHYLSGTDVKADVKNEKVLGVDLLTEIYSIPYLFGSMVHYHKYWEKILDELDEGKLRALFQNFKLDYPNTSTHNHDVVSQLKEGVRKITSTVAKVKAQEIELAEFEKSISEIQLKLDRAYDRLKNIKEQVVMWLELEISALGNEVEEYEDEREKLNDQRVGLQKQFKEAKFEVEHYKKLLQLFSDGTSMYSDFDQFIQRNDSVSELIRAEREELIAEIVEAEKAYNKTPTYNFVKRNKLQKDITENKKRFTLTVSRLIMGQMKEIQSKQNTLNKSASTLKENITELDEVICSMDENISSKKTQISSWEACLKLFSGSGFPNAQKGLSPETYEECKVVFSSYEEQQATCANIVKQLDSAKKNKKKKKQERENSAQYDLAARERDYIVKCREVLKKLQIGAILENVMLPNLREIYKAHEREYEEANYRHKLYLKLLYCWLYYSNLPNLDYFLNIDEAQDISVAEYRLLRNVLGKQCIFNLYGDINQAVYSYKNVADWEEIEDITNGNIYVLNENYRNTLQITEFCNKEFGAEVYPIGISGESVLELDLETAVHQISEIKKRNPEYRVAIIHRYGLKGIKKELRKILADQDVSWKAVDVRKICVIPVEIAKGLEFEAVVVIVDRMSDNEKYVSYTRALDKLIVVRDQISTETVADKKSAK